MAIPPTHRGDVYRPTIVRGTGKGEETKSWPSSATAVGLVTNLQAAGARLVQAQFGRHIDGVWLGIFDADADIIPGDGFRVVVSLEGGPDPPGRFEVRKIDPWGARFQKDVFMTVSGENFG